MNTQSLQSVIVSGAAVMTTAICPVERAWDTLRNPQITKQPCLDKAGHVLIDEIVGRGAKAHIARGLLFRKDIQDRLGSGVLKRYSAATTSHQGNVRRERTHEERDAQRRRHEANVARRSAENAARSLMKGSGSGKNK